jgi:hypothetical protein
MKTFLTAVAALLFAHATFAADLNLSVCQANGWHFDIQVTDAQVTLRQIWPQADNLVFTKTSEETFKPGELGEGESIALALAKLSSYQDGLYVEMSSDSSDFQMMIFNYGNNQKSVLLVDDGDPYLLGKTEDCR